MVVVCSCGRLKGGGESRLELGCKTPFSFQRTENKAGVRNTSVTFGKKEVLYIERGEREREKGEREERER